MAYIPTVIRDEGNFERAYDIYSRMLADRIIFLDQEINDAVASTITAQLHLMVTFRKVSEKGLRSLQLIIKFSYSLQTPTELPVRNVRASP